MGKRGHELLLHHRRIMQGRETELPLRMGEETAGFAAQPASLVHGLCFDLFDILDNCDACRPATKQLRGVLHHVRIKGQAIDIGA